MGNTANCVCYSKEKEIDLDIESQNTETLERKYIQQFTIDQDYMVILVVCLINQQVNQWEQRYTHDSLAQISKVFRVNDHIKEDYELMKNIDDSIYEFELVKESDPNQGIILKFQSVCNQIVHKVQLELPIKPIKQEVLINMIAKYNYKLKQEMHDQQKEIDNLKQLIQLYSNSQMTQQSHMNVLSTQGDTATINQFNSTINFLNNNNNDNIINNNKQLQKNHSKKDIFSNLQNENKKNKKKVQILTSNPSTNTSTGEKQKVKEIKENTYILKAGQSNNKGKNTIENIIEDNIKKNKEISQKFKVPIQYTVDKKQVISKGIQVSNNKLMIKNIGGGDQGWVYLTPSLNKNESQQIQIKLSNLPSEGNINIGIVDMDFQKEGSLFITDFDNIGQYYVICNCEQSGQSIETEIQPIDFNFKSKDDIIIKFIPQEFKLKFYNLTQKKKCQIENVVIKEKPVFAIYLYEKDTSCEIIQVKSQI